MQDVFGETGLHEACDSGNYEVVQVLSQQNVGVF